MRARLRGTTPVAAACASLLEAPERPPFVRRGFAHVAVSVTEGGSGLWAHHFRKDSVRALEAALRVAGNEDLPLPVRRAVLDLAEESSVPDHPGRARPAPLTPEEATRLRMERETIRSRLQA